jgi:hypothetical protein
MLGHAHRDQRQLSDLMPPRPHRVNQIRLSERARARAAPFGPMVDDLINLRERKQRPVPALVSGLTAALATGAGRGGPGGTEGGSCDGGSDELRELRFRRRSSSTTRASSRWFASTSSPTRISSATAVSRSPSKMDSASARSIPPNFAATQRVPAHGLNAY